MKIQLPDSPPTSLQLKILKAEDSRNEKELKELAHSIDENQTDAIIRLVIASGRIPSFEVWKSLAGKFGTNRAIAEALALTVRFPDTQFPVEDVFRILRTLPPGKTLTETFLFLNSRDAFDYARTLNHDQEIVASNLWRSKDFVHKEVLRQYYAAVPEATVYSVYRTRTKGIVKSSDLRNMALENRYYGCLVCDHPEEFLSDPDWQVRIAAVIGANSLAAAEILLSDPVALVRIAAIQVYLGNNGPPEIFRIEKVNVMEAEILCPYLKDKSIVKQIFERRGHFSEIAAPFLGRPDREKILSSGLSDRAKVLYLEKQFGNESAIDYARTLFRENDSSFALRYLLELKAGINKEEIIEMAKKKGTFGSELQDFGFLEPESAPQPLSFYLDTLTMIQKYRGFEIHTEKGSITCSFFRQQAPLTCANFIRLVKKKYFNGSYFHRVIPGFVAQDGDPTGTGSGGPGYSIRCEYHALKYDRPGMVGMALAGKDTGGSQFFITHLPTPHLNHHYTIFARVIKGLGILSNICRYDRILKIHLF